MRTTVTYRWRDLNGNRDYDPGEVNLNTNGPDFVSQSAGTNTVANPDERQPKSDEFSVSLERELMANFALRVSGIYSEYHDTYRMLNVLRPYETYNVPVTRPDPGPDGVAGNADDPGSSFTYWEYPTTLSGRAFERFMLINDPQADQTYKSIDIALFKRLSNSWQLLASYSATKINVPIQVNATGTTTAERLERRPESQCGNQYVGQHLGVDRQALRRVHVSSVRSRLRPSLHMRAGGRLRGRRSSQAAERFRPSR